MASIALRHQVVILSSIILCGLCSSTARAAFVSCEDARNYGANSARSFVGQSFARIACNADMLERVHFGLDRVLSRQVLRTYDSDDEKLCFYQGMFEGLFAQLESEYAECANDARFACLSAAVLSSHLGSLVSALSASLSDPAALGVEGLVTLFAPGPTSLCSAADTQVCSDAVLQSLSPLARCSFPQAQEPLGALVCGN